MNLRQVMRDRPTLAQIQHGGSLLRSAKGKPLLCRVAMPYGAARPEHRFFWLPYGMLLYRNLSDKWLADKTPLYVGENLKLVVTMEAIAPGEIGPVAARGAEFRLAKHEDEFLESGAIVGWDSAARVISRRNVPKFCGFAVVRGTAYPSMTDVRVRVCNYVHPDAVMVD